MQSDRNEGSGPNFVDARRLPATLNLRTNLLSLFLRMASTFRMAITVSLVTLLTFNFLLADIFEIGFPAVSEVVTAVVKLFAPFTRF